MSAQHGDDDIPIWDQAAAAQSVGDAMLARRLLRQLCQALPDALDELRRLHGTGALTAAAEHAHQISGGAAYCAVTPLRNCLKTLEQRARDGDTPGTATALDALAAEVERLLEHERRLD